ncbi:hypothetical protein LPJ71_002967 [Coemansia sp. S17]|nr:hypothetical protein LPJ71_002967 [Coemansia sp. S17]
MTDISLLRQVPDHQEVFADAQTDASIIIEILESVPHKGIEALEYHYEQVSDLNADDQPHQFLHVGPLSLDSVAKDSAFILCGQQEAAKFNEGAQAKNTVVVCMALLRLPEHSTDILVTKNTPTRISSKSSSHTDSQQPMVVDAKRLLEEFTAMLKTFTINNRDIFG